MVIKIISLVSASLIVCTSALADGGGMAPGAEGCGNAAGCQITPHLDNRLPPVIPGQTVNINGQKIKVWSTSGPVPVSNPPEPWREFNGRTYTDVPLGVIADTRRNGPLLPNRVNPNNAPGVNSDQIQTRPGFGE